jgi:hypothetical protein
MPSLASTSMSPNPIRHSILRWQLQQKIQQRFDDLEAYAMQFEIALIRDRATMEADSSLREISHPEQMGDHEIERYQEEMRRFTDEFPQILRASALSTIQASLETHLMAIARLHALGLSKTFEETTWIKKKGSRIWGTKAFIEDECGRRSSEAYWPTVSDYSNVRNAIVHGEGRIGQSLKNPAAIWAAAGRLEHVRITEADQIILDDLAVRDFAQTSKFLCLELLGR